MNNTISPWNPRREFPGYPSPRPAGGLPQYREYGSNSLLPLRGGGFFPGYTGFSRIFELARGRSYEPSVSGLRRVADWYNFPKPDLYRDPDSRPDRLQEAALRGYPYGRGRYDDYLTADCQCGRYGCHARRHSDPHDVCGCGRCGAGRCGAGRCGAGRCGMRDCDGCCSSSKSGSSVSTKDVVIRGKTYQFRKSFLSDSSKFETELVKYVDKKKDWEVPDSVLKLLESFINTDEYNTCSVVDEVTLNILASKLGAKSVMEYSLKSLEKNYPVSGQDLVFVTMTIMLSSKVDDGLKEWLKKQLKYDMRYEHLGNNTHWQIATGKHPEVITRVMELLGLIEKQENEIFRIL